MEAVRWLVSSCMSLFCKRIPGVDGMPLGGSSGSSLGNLFCQLPFEGVVILDLLYHRSCISGVPDVASYKCSDWLG